MPQTGRTGAKHSYGTIFEVKFGDSTTYVAVAEIDKLGHTGHKADMIDASHLTSPNRYKEFVKGLLDAGACSFEGNWLPLNASQLAALADLQDEVGDPHEMRIRWFGDLTKTISFWGFVEGLDTTAAINAQARFSGSAKITGKVEYSEPA